MKSNETPLPKVDLFYGTDPLCSFCWVFEPTIRKFRYQYAKYIADDTTIMGGMIEKWDTYGGEEVDKTSQALGIATQWHEIGDYTRMVIDGRIWLDEPVRSSYPSSQIYGIMHRDYPEKANLFLRKVRETVMLWNQDVSKREVLEAILNEIGLDAKKIWEDAHSFEGRMLMNGDLSLAQTLTISSFPTIIMVNEKNQGIKVVGAQTYDALVEALQQILPEGTTLVPNPVPSLDVVMKEQPLMLSKEMEVLYDLSESEVNKFVDLTLGKENYQKGELFGQPYYQKV
ncbi:DsbA family protein [Jeotgalibaca sp. MA1X17-3]|uniref:DsbA family oxidoreductase n=1 Tax=Jeotgalibaca sp. MA1X17-3 TaxID=2908211 RepID=UPI001F318660|nr:DsbA family protein [Jeotgalibaca sp. MA1X17-3]UJF16185.1 DsbA family protein [Jeotgalibaca sp. MA1X17-3]